MLIKSMEKLKQCTKCKEWKNLEKFGKNRNEKDGLQWYCKECRKQYQIDNINKIKIYRKQWYKNNKKENNIQSKKYYQKNKKYFSIRNKKYCKDNTKEIKIQKKQYYQNNKKDFSIKSEEYYKKNSKKIKIQSKKYYQNNNEKIKIQSKKYRQNNVNKIKIRKEQYKKNNIKKIKVQRKQWHENRFKIDIHYKIKMNISSLVRTKLKFHLSSKRGKSTFKDILPYTVEELKQHLESQFKSWMSWDNWGAGNGKWNIDHIRPDSSFNYKNVEDEEFQECWSLDNLQPLDAIENIKKGNRIIK